MLPYDARARNRPRPPQRRAIKRRATNPCARHHARRSPRERLGASAPRPTLRGRARTTPVELTVPNSPCESPRSGRTRDWMLSSAVTGNPGRTYAVTPRWSARRPSPARQCPAVDDCSPVDVRAYVSVHSPPCSSVRQRPCRADVCPVVRPPTSVAGDVRPSADVRPMSRR